MIEVQLEDAAKCVTCGHGRGAFGQASSGRVAARLAREGWGPGKPPVRLRIRRRYRRGPWSVVLEGGFPGWDELALLARDLR